MNETTKNTPVGEKTSFTDIADIVYITPENSFFSLSKNGFLTLISEIDAKPEALFDEEGEAAPPRGDYGGHGAPPGSPPRGHGGHHGAHGRHGGKKNPCEVKYTKDGKRDYGRVILHRAFPFDMPDKCISVMTEDEKEIGIIRDISDFDEKTRKMIADTLGAKYFVPEITKIISTNDRFGYVYFRCETNAGMCDFAVRNPLGSIIHLSDTRIIIVDTDGCRYSVKNVQALDKKSYRKIELYL